LLSRFSIAIIVIPCFDETQRLQTHKFEEYICDGHATCVQDLARRHAGASVVVVSHVGPIKALLCAVLDVPLTAARRMFLDSATVSVIDWGAEAVDWGANMAKTSFTYLGS
jgi:Histidine phosphatase superfamily (branch 1)